MAGPAVPPGADAAEPWVVPVPAETPARRYYHGLPVARSGASAMGVMVPVHIVGRRGERALLAGLVADLAAGRGHAVLLSGEPGIGKTALLRLVAGDVAASRIRLLRGAGHQGQQRQPFSAVLPCLRSPDLPAGPALDAVLTSIAAIQAGAAQAGRQSGVAEAVVALLAGLAAEPLAVLVDDLQWADPASRLVLHRLGRLLARAPLLIAAATRPAPGDEDLERLLRGLRSRGQVLVELAPLDDAEVVELVRARTGTEPDAALLRMLGAAGGNPHYLAELVDALRRPEPRPAAGGVPGAGGVPVPGAGGAPGAGDIPVGDMPDMSGGSGAGGVSAAGGLAGDGDAVPGAVREAVLRQSGGLPAATRELLAVAAVLGAELDVTNLSHVVDRPVGELLVTLQAAAAAGVLGEHAGRLVFRHDLVRQALAGTLPRAGREAVHLRAGHALAGSGAAPERVAGQYLAAGPLDPAALGWLVAAAPGLARRAPALAADLIDHTLAGGSIRGRDAAALRFERARALFQIQDLAAAERELRALPQPDPATGGRYRWLLAQVLLRQGRPDLARAEATAALAVLTVLPPPAASPPALPPTAALSAVPPSSAASLAAPPSSAASSAAPPPTAEMPTAEMPTAEMPTAEMPTAPLPTPAPAAAAHAVPASPDLPAGLVAGLHGLVAQCALLGGDGPAAVRAAHLAVAGGDAGAGRYGGPAFGLSVLAAARWLAGDAAAGLVLIDRALESLGGSGPRADLEMAPHLVRGWCLFELGRAAEADAELERGARLAGQVGSPLLAWYRLAEGYQRFLTGRWEQVPAGPPAGGDPFRLGPGLAALAALVAAHRGGPDPGGPALPPPEQANPRCRHLLTWARALAAEAAGNPGQALELLAGCWERGPAAARRHLHVLCPDLARLLADAGDAAGLAGLAASLGRLSMRRPAPGLLASLSFVLGVAGSDAAALHSAAAAYRAAGDVLRASQAQEYAAQALARAGDTAAARTALDLAVRGYQALGAHRDLARAQQRMRLLGVARSGRERRGRPTSGWDALTATERHIAAQVGAGHSNRAIAEQMFLSPRTVQTHVSRILAKMQLASRVELAVVVAQGAGPAEQDFSTVADVVRTNPADRKRIR
jgi:DNA-binding NarL/FixJ family response regulator